MWARTSRVRKIYWTIESCLVINNYLHYKELVLRVPSGEH